MTALRVVVGVIITAIVAVSLVPMFVLVDLVSGGDGFGLCPDGVTSCRTSYFDAPELLAGLTIVMFLLLMLLRGALHLYRMMLAEQREDAVAASLRTGERRRA